MKITTISILIRVMPDRFKSARGLVNNEHNTTHDPTLLTLSVVLISEIIQCQTSHSLFSMFPELTGVSLNWEALVYWLGTISPLTMYAWRFMLDSNNRKMPWSYFAVGCSTNREENRVNFYKLLTHKNVMKRNVDTGWDVPTLGISLCAASI